MSWYPADPKAFAVMRSSKYSLAAAAFTLGMPADALASPVADAVHASFLSAAHLALEEWLPGWPAVSWAFERFVLIWCRPPNRPLLRSAHMLALGDFFRVGEYQAYVVGEDGHIAGFSAFVCDSDADATVLAKQLVDGHDIELWSGERFVIRLESKPK